MIFNYNTKNELNEMKKTNRYIYDLIALKRKKLMFDKKDIPFNVLRNYIMKSPNLEELYFSNPSVLKHNDVLALEQLNLLQLKVLDVMGLGRSFTEKAMIRLVHRCKNIEELRVNCSMPLRDEFFFSLQTLRKLQHLAINSHKELSGTELLNAQEMLKVLSLHVKYIKVRTLSVYELSE